MAIRTQIRFTGRVQGVGFRATTRAIARMHAVTGWVRNEPDGAVLAQFQGTQPEIEACVARLRDEMGENIQRADRVDFPPEPDEAAFEITY